MRDVRKRFGDAVRRERGRRAISQERLGELAGLDRTYVSSVERGERNISIVNINKIAGALEISLTQLFRQVDRSK